MFAAGGEGRGAGRTMERRASGAPRALQLCGQLTAWVGQSSCETPVEIVGLHWAERFFKECHTSHWGIRFPKRLRTVVASLQ